MVIINQLRIFSQKKELNVPTKIIDSKSDYSSEERDTYNMNLLYHKLKSVGYCRKACYILNIVQEEEASVIELLNT